MSSKSTGFPLSYSNPKLFLHGMGPWPIRTDCGPNPKTGRNDLCPCGSGKKFKRCCALKARR